MTNHETMSLTINILDLSQNEQTLLLAEIFTVQITNMTHKLLPRLGVSVIPYTKQQNSFRENRNLRFESRPTIQEDFANEIRRSLWPEYMY